MGVEWLLESGKTLRRVVDTLQKVILPTATYDVGKVTLEVAGNGLDNAVIPYWLEANLIQSDAMLGGLQALNLVLDTEPPIKSFVAENGTRSSSCVVHKEDLLGSEK